MTAGEQVGASQIVSRIGQRAMGEVWRASDPRLARDAEHLARFEHEVRALAALLRMAA